MKGFTILFMMLLPFYADTSSQEEELSYRRRDVEAMMREERKEAFVLVAEYDGTVWLAKVLSGDWSLMKCTAPVGQPCKQIPRSYIWHRLGLLDDDAWSTDGEWKVDCCSRVSTLHVEQVGDGYVKLYARHVDGDEKHYFKILEWNPKMKGNVATRVPHVKDATAFKIVRGEK